MNKTELLAAVAKESGIKKPEVDIIIDAFFNGIQDAVAKGEKVQITGFGSFERRERGARTVTNPRTGEPLDIAASKSPAFSAGSIFKEKVNK